MPYSTNSDESTIIACQIQDNEKLFILYESR